MKHNYAVFTMLLVISSLAFGQQWSGSNNTTSAIYRSGNVGIGLTTAPLAKLDISAAPVLQIRLRGTGSPNYWNIFHNASATADYGLTFGGSNGNAYLVLNDVGAGGHSSFPLGRVGFGTRSPAAPLHLYSSSNPTVMRIQSSAAFGAGRIEFWSDPQNSASEWRPGYIQSTDNGNFTGGLAFFVNGTSTGNKTNFLEAMRIVNGNVGIGTTAPAAKLDIVGPTPYQLRLKGTGSPNNWLVFHNANAANDFGLTFADNGGNRFILNDRGNTSFPTGNVGIGTTNPTHKLSVNGSIRAKEVIVNTGWSDFVFEDDYKLMPLYEVESYIQENGHLPEIQTTAEVQANGVSLGEMQAKLLQKIEELTLYLIEVKKENAALASQLSVLRAQMDQE